MALTPDQISAVRALIIETVIETVAVVVADIVRDEIALDAQRRQETPHPALPPAQLGAVPSCLPVQPGTLRFAAESAV